MKESVVSEKKAGSVSAKRAKEAASLTRDGLKVADRPLMNIVRRAGCTDCRPSVQSLAGGIMQTPVAQRQAAAMLLQRSRGNKFVQDVAIQAKLMVGPADDEYEREADRVADQVMSMPEPRAQRACPSCEEEEGVQRAPLASRITPLVQREAAPEEEEEIQTKSMLGRIANRIQRAPEEEEEIQTKPQPGRIANRIQRAPEEEEEIQTKPMAGQVRPFVQRQAAPEEEEQVQRQAAPEEEEEIQTKRSVGAIGGPASTELEQSLSQSRGSGSPLAEGVRGRMENAFGVDFGGVSVHSDARADSLNRSIQARAFTRGQDIFLRQGEYRPASSEGQRLLAHELTHVVQQNGDRMQQTITQMERPLDPATSFPLDGLTNRISYAFRESQTRRTLQMKTMSISFPQDLGLYIKNRDVIQRVRRPSQRGAARRQWGDRSRYGRQRFSSAIVPNHILRLGDRLKQEYQRDRRGGGGLELRNYVYIGTSGGVGTYVGITDDPDRRQEGHGGRFHLHVLNRSNPFSRIEVRGIEQALINLGRGSMLNQNIAESISRTHPYYGTAVRFGRAFWIWAFRIHRDEIRFAH